MLMTSKSLGQEVDHIPLTEANTKVIQDQGHVPGQEDTSTDPIQGQEVAVTTNTQGQDQGHHTIAEGPDIPEVEAENDHHITETETATVRNMVMEEVTADHHPRGTGEEEGNTRTPHQCQTEEGMLVIGTSQNPQNVLVFLDSVYIHKREI